MAKEGTGDFLLKAGIVIGGATLGYFLVVRPIFCMLGIQDCRSARARNLMKYKGFDPNYYLTKQGQVSISAARAKELAAKIYSSFGIINDDESEIYAALRSANSAVNLSYVSHFYYIKYKKQMVDDLLWYLDDKAEENRIFEIIRAY